MSLHIHVLECTNINSLSGTWRIDFDAMGENPLYLISGPTGVGKSTILDAICMAFFGVTPRLGSVSNHDDILHQGTLKGRSRVEFSVDGVRYAVSFIVEKSEKTGKMRQAQHILENGEGRVIASGLTSCRKETEKLLGMDSGRFLRTTLLAQGQFASFLLAEPKERAAILERITQTSIYGTISIAAYEQATRLQGELNEMEKNCPADVSEQKRLFDNEAACRETALTAVEDELATAKNREELRRERLRLVGEAWESRREQRKYRCEKELHTEENLLLRENLDAYKKLLDTLPARPLPVSPLLYAESKACAEELCGLEKDLTVKNAAYEALLKDVATKQEILAQGNFVKYTALAKAVINARKRLQTPPDLSEWHAKNRRMGELPQDDDTLYKEKQVLLTNFLEQMRVLKSDRLERRMAQEIVAHRPEPSQPLRETLERIERGLVLAKKSRELWQKRGQDNMRLKSLRAETAVLEKKLSVYQTAYNACAFYRAYYELRQMVHEGEKCPLCGSVIGTFAECPEPERVVTENDLEEIRQALARAREEKERLLAARRAFNKEIRECLKDACPLALTAYVQELRELEAEARRKEENYGRALNILASSAYQRQREKAVSLAQELLAFRREHPQVRASKLPLFGEKKALQRELEILHGHLAETLVAVRDGRRELRRLLTEKECVKRDVDRDRAALKALGADPEHAAEILRRDLSDLKRRINDVTSRKQKTDETVAQSEKAFAVQKAEWERVRDELCALLPSVRPFAETSQKASGFPTRTEHAAWETGRVNCMTKYADVRKNLHECSRKFHALRDFGFAVSEISETRDGILQRLGLVSAAGQKLAAQEKERQQAVQAIAEMRERIVLPLELQKLIGSAKGDRFRIFAQSLTLERVLDRANGVLEQMMPRYRLERSLEEDLGILVDDDLMGGRLRSVRTLSGGETFIVSLALAMGLSEMSGRSSSLFLDEGFGTLDEESLRLVIDALQRLSDTGISCGIISHVQELREAIPLQIHVLPNGQGRSRIEGNGCQQLPMA